MCGNGVWRIDSGTTIEGGGSGPDEDGEILISYSTVESG